MRGRGVDYAPASALYAQHDTWPDRTHQQHSQMLAAQGRVEDAQKALSRIKGTDARQAAEAELLRLP